MPAYKETDGKTWTIKFKYKDWQGNLKSVTKRGFETKRDALEWETNFKLEKAGNMDMTFGDFVERYKKDRLPRIKLSTSITKEHVIDKHIVPFFGKKKVAEITASDVIAWQNELMTATNPGSGKLYSRSYLKKVHSELSAILNYAVRYFGLKDNPAVKVGNMGSEKDIKMNFWTKEEYLRFAEVMMDKPFMYYCFETLYWTGMREGELLALTLEDIDFENRTISINKTFHHLKGQDIITSPKTKKSYRTITIPEFLAVELKEYVQMIYDPDPEERLFPTDKSVLAKNLHKGARAAGLKRIRVHDLRHSHVSLLIHMGYSAVAIGERVGHESVTITYKYAHMFPTVQKDMAARLNEIKGGDNDVRKNQR